MDNLFWKKCKWTLPVVVVSIVICTACGKEKDEQKMMASLQNSDVRISEVRNVLQEQPDILSEDVKETVKSEEENMEDDIEISKVDEERKEDGWNVDFEVVRAEYIYDEQQNKIEIYYPQLNGFVDSAKEERINALIEADVMQIIGERNKDGDDTVYRIDLEYKIKFLNERIISIIYEGWRGYYMPGDARLIEEAITTTIDIEKEKVVTLQDVVTNLRELSVMLMADEFECITMWEGKKGRYRFSEEFRGTTDELEENLWEKQHEWYTDGENFIVIDKEKRYYNEYSISNESVEHILDPEFLKKLE